MSDFRKVLSCYDLRDLCYIGSPFTWCNNRYSDSRIFERHDFFLANSLWCENFPLGVVRHGHATYSDHCSIMLNTFGVQRFISGPKLFKFEAMWLREEKCTNIISDMWALDSSDGTIENTIQLIENCGMRLTYWNKVSFGHVQ